MRLKRLKELREKNRYSLKFLGDYLDISYQAYSNYETKDMEPSANSLKKLSNLYGVSTDYILECEKSLDYEIYSNEVQEMINAMVNVDQPTQKKILAGAKAFVPEAFGKYPKGYKYPIGFTNPVDARQYYYSKVVYSAASDGKEPNDQEIIELANDIYEEERNKKY